MAGPIPINLTAPINMTLLVSIGMVCLTALGVLVRVFGKKKSEEPGTHPTCLAHDRTIKRNEKEVDDLRGKVESMRTEISVNSVKLENNEKNIEEMKRDTRKMADKMDDLLTQVLELLN